MIKASRRSFITGLVALVAAPAIVRASNLMPVKIMENDPLVRGIRYQTWPFGLPQPGNDYWSGSSWVDDAQGPKPMSYFTNSLKERLQKAEFDRLDIKAIDHPYF